MTAKKIPSLPALDAHQRYAVHEAIVYLRTSRKSFYAALARGEINTTTQGRRRYVHGSEIIRLSRA